VSKGEGGGGKGTINEIVAATRTAKGEDKKGKGGKRAFSGNTVGLGNVTRSPRIRLLHGGGKRKPPLLRDIS